MFHYSQKKMFVIMHAAIIGGQPVHDAIAKLHDAIFGGTWCNCENLSVSVILSNQN